MSGLAGQIPRRLGLLLISSGVIALASCVAPENPLSAPVFTRGQLYSGHIALRYLDSVRGAWGPGEYSWLEAAFVGTSAWIDTALIDDVDDRYLPLSPGHCVAFSTSGIPVYAVPADMGPWVAAVNATNRYVAPSGGSSYYPYFYSATTAFGLGQTYDVEIDGNFWASSLRLPRKLIMPGFTNNTTAGTLAIPFTGAGITLHWEPTGADETLFEVVPAFGAAAGGLCWAQTDGTLSLSNADAAAVFGSESGAMKVTAISRDLRALNGRILVIEGSTTAEIYYRTYY